MTLMSRFRHTERDARYWKLINQPLTIVRTLAYIMHHAIYPLSVSADLKGIEMRKDYVVTGLMAALLLIMIGMLQFGKLAEPGQPVVRLIDFLFKFYLGA